MNGSIHDLELGLLRQLEELIRDESYSTMTDEEIDTKTDRVHELLGQLDAVRRGQSPMVCMVFPPTHSGLVIGPKREIDYYLSIDPLSESAAWATIATIAIDEDGDVATVMKDDLFGPVVA